MRFFSNAGLEPTRSSTTVGPKYLPRLNLTVTFLKEGTIDLLWSTMGSTSWSKLFLFALKTLFGSMNFGDLTYLILTDFFFLGYFFCF